MGAATSTRACAYERSCSHDHARAARIHERMILICRDLIHLGMWKRSGDKSSEGEEARGHVRREMDGKMEGYNERMSFKNIQCSFWGLNSSARKVRKNSENLSLLWYFWSEQYPDYHETLNILLQDTLTKSHLCEWLLRQSDGADCTNGWTLLTAIWFPFK